MKLVSVRDFPRYIRYLSNQDTSSQAISPVTSCRYSAFNGTLVGSVPSFLERCAESQEIDRNGPGVFGRG